MSGYSTADGDPESRPVSYRLEDHNRKMPKRAYAMCLGGLFLGLFAGFSIASKSIAPAPFPQSPETATPRTLQAPTPWTIPGDGEFLVGTNKLADVHPGLYRSEGNTRWCMWQREKDATGEHIVASDTAEGITYVQLRSGEFFDTNGCNTWHRVTGLRAPR